MKTGQLRTVSEQRNQRQEFWQNELLKSLHLLNRSQHTTSTTLETLFTSTNSQSLQQHQELLNVIKESNTVTIPGLEMKLHSMKTISNQLIESTKIQLAQVVESLSDLLLDTNPKVHPSSRL